MSYSEVARPRKGLTFWWLFVLFLCASYVFDEMRGNPFAIKYSSDVTFPLMGAIATYSLLQSALRKGSIARMDLLVYGLSTIALGLTVYNAWKHYGQPFWLGMADDRRILGILSYFPIVRAFRQGRLDERLFYKLVQYVATVAIVLSVLAVLVGKRGEVSSDDLRSGRFSLGTHFVVLFAFISYMFFWNLPKQRRARWLGWLLASIATIILIVQTRQIILTIFMVMGVYSMRRKSFWVLMPMLLLGGVVVSLALAEVFLATGYGQRVAALWVELLDSSYLEHSARANNISTILHVLRTEGWSVGHGNLSLLWHGGFKELYGPNFILADVGLFGMAFRYGVPLAIFFSLWALYLLWRTWVRIPENLPLVRGLFLMGAIYVMVFPGAGLFLYGGLPMGVILGFATGMTERARQLAPAARAGFHASAMDIGGEPRQAVR